MIRPKRNKRGFTLIELMVCLIIFVIMTALLVMKYGNFNQNVLLTNIAYDSALAIRTSQNYGMSVKAVEDSSGEPVTCGLATGQFQCIYGTAFSVDGPTETSAFDNTKFVLFASANGVSYNSSNDQLINTYTLKRGATISEVCAVSGDDCTPGSKLYISFKRPDPDARICIEYSNGSSSCTVQHAKITIKATDGSTRSISVRSNGQISVDI